MHLIEDSEYKPHEVSVVKTQNPIYTTYQLIVDGTLQTQIYSKIALQSALYAAIMGKGEIA